MQLRGRDVAGLAGFGNGLTAFHLLAALYVKRAVVGVGRDEAIGVADEDEVAITFELIAGIGDDAVVGRLHGSAFRYGDVDAVIAGEAVNDTAACRPAEFRIGRNFRLRQACRRLWVDALVAARSEEHTSELQSRQYLV